MSYKGRYTLKHPEKYIGDAKKVVYRWLWERQAFKWCENNPKVKAWNSEEIVVPYKSSVDKKLHRYFVDLLIQMEDKSTYLVEIKPKKETKPPKKPKRKSNAFDQGAATIKVDMRTQPEKATEEKVASNGANNATVRITPF